MKMNIPFMKASPLLTSISIIAVIISIYTIATKGFNYGIDFKGGAKLEYKFDANVNEGQVRDALKSLKLGDLSVVRFGEASEQRMSIKVEMPDEHSAIAPQVTSALEKTFGVGKILLEQEETVGPKVGKELRTKAWYTILLSWALMLVYIGYRFDFYFAPGAVLALIHDVSITLALFAFMGKEMNLTIIAALLTLIGYSINDTIVVFDRIRENKDQINKQSVTNIVNDSLNATFSRTLITSLTVLLVVVVLFYKGGGTLHDFAFALIVGAIVGTYSSIFVAAPSYIAIFRHWDKFSKANK